MIGPAAPIFKVMKFEIQHAVESKVHLAIGHWLAEGRRKPRFLLLLRQIGNMSNTLHTKYDSGSKLNGRN